MKEFKINTEKLIRVQFGSKSVSFIDTDLDQVFEIAVKVFKDAKINTVIELNNHCPLQKPLTGISINMNVREEHGSVKGKCKSKMLYGLTPDQALKIFKKEYEMYLTC